VSRLIATTRDEIALTENATVGWQKTFYSLALRSGDHILTASLPLSSHTFNEPSAHVLAVTPTAHWLEYLDIAGSVLTERLLPQDGKVAARGPGLGITWDEQAVLHYSWK
jgi:hypothetical protein